MYGPVTSDLTVVATTAMDYTSAISKTATIPPEVLGDDLIVACVMHRDELTPPSGWTPIASSGSFVNSNYKQATTILTRRAIAADANQQVTFTQASSDRMAVQILVVRGATKPVVVGVGTHHNNAEQGYYKAIPSVAATLPDQLAVTAVSWIYAATTDPNTAQVSAPWTQATPTTSSDTTNQIRCGVAYRGISAPEVAGGAFNVNADGAGDGGVTIIIEPEQPTDPYWNDVASLLHFEGDNGSTTFTDEKGWVWTASGAAQIDASKAKIGNASGKFGINPGGDQIATSTHGMDITQDFTVECFVYWDGSGASTFYQWFQNVDSGFYARIEPSGVIQTYTCGGTFDSVVTTATVPVNTWTNITITCEAGVVKIYINGILEGNGAVTQPTVNPTTDARIGEDTGGADRHFRGNIDEFRFTNGVARYTGNFTPTKRAFYDGPAPALKARSEVSVVMVVESPSHGATINTKQALLDAGFLDANITIHQDTTAPPAADIILICRAIDSQSDWDMVAPAWQSGTPVIFGSKNGQTDQSNQDHAATYAGLANQFYAATSSSYDSINVFCNTHYITAHMALGENLFYTGTTNYMYALSAPGNHVGFTMAYSDNSGAELNNPTLVAIEKGTEDLNGNNVPVRSVILADLYGGQNPYTVAGREVIARSIEWCLGYEMS